MTPCQQLASKAILTIGIFAIGLRLLPYLAPVRTKDILQTDRAVEFQDRNGLPLGRLLSRNQDHTAVVPLNDISPAFLQAIIAAEDGRFYQHGPVDSVALGRAVLEAVQARQIMSGASTITMQLARMVDPTPPTMFGKLQEIWLAWRMGAGMNHRDILSAYVNRLPMGGNLYGVEAAAQAYFGSSAKDLNLAQSSLLAAIPNDPNQLNPYDHWSALKKRQRYVLEQMQQDGYISLQQVDRVMAETVKLQPRQKTRLAAPHFLFWLSDQLPGDHPAQVITTLDRTLQQYVQAQVQAVIRDLAAHQVTQAAALVIDNDTGEVLAYVGSTDYFEIQGAGRNDGVQALRQPGSTLKPFLYGLALEQGYLQPNSILADIPTAYAIPGGQLYQPLDYHERFLGPVRVRVALANSLNVPAVRLLERVTVSDFLHHLHELQFKHLKNDPEFYGLGLALGSGEVTLWELAQAYVALANQGRWTPLQTLKPSSQAEPQSASPLTTQFSPETWAFITDILSDRYTRAQSFGVDSVLSLPFPTAVKTGTSSDYRDTWTIGFTRDYTVATWVGNFDGSPMNNVSGVTGAAPLWNRIMLHLHEQHEPESFEAPQGWVPTPICAVSGQKPTAACPTIVEEYLNEVALARYESGEAAFFDTVETAAVRSHPNQLPPAYDGWLAQHPETSWIQGLKIVSPKAGDTYLIPVASSSAQQTPQLEFKVAGEASRPLQWRLNGQPFPAQEQSSWFWPLQPGDWTLTVTDGNDTDQIQFKVLEDPQPQERKGFSIHASQP